MRLVSPLALVALYGCSNDISVIEKENVEPAASINSPTDGVAVTANQNVDFVGTVADGNGLEDITTVTWNSSIDGELASNDLARPDADGITRVATLLSTGVHVITLRAIDTEGAIGEDSITVSVGDVDVAPLVSISEPATFADFFLGETVALLGTANDPQQSSDSLIVEWIAVEQNSGVETTIFSGSPDGNGLVSGGWQPDATGDYILTLIAMDDEGNTGEDSVAIEVENPDGADLDGDGFSVLTGDCDDTDANISPNADEICGDAIDNDCSGVVDDKDTDNDSHIDVLCVNYPGVLPIDDCDDDNSAIYPGSGELQDGLDNDCDGFVDEDTPAFDDDGDCFCEVGPCLDSVEPTCASLVEGDCDDSDPDSNPAAADSPDMGYTDNNCDGIDGDLANSVFLDPIGGNNGADGLTQGTAVFNLDTAFSIAQAQGRSWILISSGTLDFRAGSSLFAQGVNLAGGYDTNASWGRAAGLRPTVAMTADGKTITNWANPTEWQQVRFTSDNASASGASSTVLTLLNTQGLLLDSCELAAGNGANGTAGSPGTMGALGGDGEDGEDGYNSSCTTSILCGTICSPNSTRPPRGTGGLSCDGSFGALGGYGQEEIGQTGSSAGSASGGAGGPKEENGGTGDPGAAGPEGTPGNPGSAFGTWSASGYAPGNGTAGLIGTVGFNAAGGGGGGGGQEGICRAHGGSGGGGGGGGCGGTPGTPGTGAGASVALLSVDSSVILANATIETGTGGIGGTGGGGGSGGAGGFGGDGGLGDDDGGVIGGGGNSGRGGPGGDGGVGGRGGHGGGGGGGPSVGVVCVGGASPTQQNVTFVSGSGGAGGAGPGSPGNQGLSAPTHGCP